MLAAIEVTGPADVGVAVGTDVVATASVVGTTMVVVANVVDPGCGAELETVVSESAGDDVAVVPGMEMSEPVGGGTAIVVSDSSVDDVAVGGVVSARSVVVLAVVLLVVVDRTVGGVVTSTTGTVTYWVGDGAGRTIRYVNSAAANTVLSTSDDRRISCAISRPRDGCGRSGSRRGRSRRGGGR